ncbi:MAG: cupin domain-containing protein [Spirochaetota bacterium]
MIIKKSNMKKEIRRNMRGGEGEIEILHFVEQADMKNCRLMAELTIPVGGSIGDHPHENETEYFIMLEGRARVLDNDEEKEFEAGDVSVTGGGARHSIVNTGNCPVKLVAVIITE